MTLTENQWLIVYSVMVILSALAGGGLPFIGKVTHQRLQLYISASAGVMLGAACFHVMAHALEMCKSELFFGTWLSLGVVGLFCMERFLAPHSHEVGGPGPDPAYAGKPAADCGHDHGTGHGHSHDAGHGHAHDCATDPYHSHEHAAEGCAHDHTHGGKLPAAPALAGWMAVLGLTIHTFMNGISLAGAVKADMLLQVGLPGLAIFLAIVLHKPADSLAVSMILSRKGVAKMKIMLVQLGFAAMVPIGAIVFNTTSGAVETEIQSKITGAALAFSAGTFLFIALSDLLPEVQFHSHDRGKLFAALVAGVGLMGLISYLEGHDHDHGHNHNHAPKKAESCCEGHDDHGHDHKNDHGHAH